jgi:hypothetical protein|tara:strand:+ start:2558 stop:2785 length:228 start_codon:yes stop_codon:yes gene_type:complete
MEPTKLNFSNWYRDWLRLEKKLKTNISEFKKWYKKEIKTFHNLDDEKEFYDYIFKNYQNHKIIWLKDYIIFRLRK